MENPVDHFWKLKLENVGAALEANNFKVYIADNLLEAGTLVEEKIIPAMSPESVSWGGSMTFVKSGLYDRLKDSKAMRVIDTYDKSVDDGERLERKRQALLVDLFMTGTNAVTEEGHLVNLDMVGNRIGALTFGPKNVVIFVGRNKIVRDLGDAMTRIKDFTAPANVMRLDMKTPCLKTGECVDCNSKARICNTWTITEKSFPAGRVTVVLINEDLGL